MKTENALKKLEKHGFLIRNYGNRGNWEGHYQAEKGREVISFYSQNGRVICINSRDVGDVSDPMTDYSAGVYCDNISQAIRLAERVR